MKTIVHINQHKIRSNQKTREKVPVISAKNYKGNRYGNTVIIFKDGAEVARIVYRPEKPLSCGARVWLETKNEISIF